MIRVAVRMFDPLRVADELLRGRSVVCPTTSLQPIPTLGLLATFFLD
jgi:hypothetical protein